MPRSAVLLARGWLPHVTVDLAWHVVQADGPAQLLDHCGDLPGQRVAATRVPAFDMAVESYQI